MASPLPARHAFFEKVSLDDDNSLECDPTEFPRSQLGLEREWLGVEAALGSLSAFIQKERKHGGDLSSLRASCPRAHCCCPSADNVGTDAGECGEWCPRCPITESLEPFPLLPDRDVVETVVEPQLSNAPAAKQWASSQAPLGQLMPGRPPCLPKQLTSASNTRSSVRDCPTSAGPLCQVCKQLSMQPVLMPNWLSETPRPLRSFSGRRDGVSQAPAQSVGEPSEPTNVSMQQLQVFRKVPSSLGVSDDAWGSLASSAQRLTQQSEELRSIADVLRARSSRGAASRTTEPLPS